MYWCGYKEKKRVVRIDVEKYPELHSTGNMYLHVLVFYTNMCESVFMLSVGRHEIAHFCAGHYGEVWLNCEAKKSSGIAGVVDGSWSGGRVEQSR